MKKCIKKKINKKYLKICAIFIVFTPSHILTAREISRFASEKFN